jgi:hypothetical protein
MAVRRPWDGVVPCAGTTRAGQRCRTPEIEGLDYCLHHVPDELLEEAEEITDFYRCRHDFGAPDACRQYAVAGTSPPRCKNHGANQGSVMYRQAARRVIERQVALLHAEILAGRRAWR